ncbi:MAG: mechanosensitive ion channel family protein [Planctomycetia bacterium]|jgi:small-conductance mechanosensitive channel
MYWNWVTTTGLSDPSTLQGALFLAAIYTVCTLVVSRVLTYFIRRSRWAFGRLKRRVDPTVIRYFVHFKTLLLLLVAFIIYAYQVPQLRVVLGTVAAGAGITALIIGFAAKSTISNLVSGLALAIYRPIRIGDKVTIENEYGEVEDLTLRHTIVVTWEHKRLIIPNEKLDSISIVNHSIVDPTVLCRVEVGVSFDTDLDQARRVLEQVALDCPQRKQDAELPWVRVIAHGDSAIMWRIYVWVPDMDVLWTTRYWLLEEIKKRFDHSGIEIPFPYRTLVFKRDLIRSDSDNQDVRDVTAITEKSI